MAESAEAKRAALAERQLRGISFLLTIQFILGIILTTLINYDPSKPSGVQTGFLVAHIVVAVGLLIGASARLVLSVKWRSLQIQSAVGLLSIIGAIIAGSIASANGSGIAVFIMALGFLFAFGAYGYSMSAISKNRAAVSGK